MKLQVKTKTLGDGWTPTRDIVLDAVCRAYDETGLSIVHVQRILDKLNAISINDEYRIAPPEKPKVTIGVGTRLKSSAHGSEWVVHTRLPDENGMRFRVSTLFQGDIVLEEVYARYVLYVNGRPVNPDEVEFVWQP